MLLPDPPLLVITDRRQAHAPLEAVTAAVFAAGGRWLLLREKDLAPLERIALLQRLSVLGRAYGAMVTVSADLAAAQVAGVGVHLPAGADPVAARRQLGSATLIGCSAHNLIEALRAEDGGADYVTLSPLFESASKPGYGPALGLEGLRRVAQEIAVPVIALGGIGPGDARRCLRAGAAGVAVMGGIMRAKDPGAALHAYLATIT